MIQKGVSSVGGNECSKFYLDYFRHGTLLIIFYACLISCSIENSGTQLKYGSIATATPEATIAGMNI